MWFNIFFFQNFIVYVCASKCLLIWNCALISISQMLFIPWEREREKGHVSSLHHCYLPLGVSDGQHSWNDDSHHKVEIAEIGEEKYLDQGNY